jgi:hypothetical protein
MHEGMSHVARHHKILSTFFWQPKIFVWLPHFPSLPLPLKGCMTQVNLLLWCSEMCEAWSQKRLLNNDSRHATWNGELWLTRIKVQAQHLPEHWKAPIHQEPDKGWLADPFSTTYHSTCWFFNTEKQRLKDCNKMMINVLNQAGTMLRLQKRSHGWWGSNLPLFCLLFISLPPDPSGLSQTAKSVPY